MRNAKGVYLDCYVDESFTCKDSNAAKRKF